MERRGMQTGLLGFIFGRQAGYVRRLAPLYIICVAVFAFSLVVGYGMGESVAPTVLEDLLGAFPDFEEFDVTMIFLFMVLGFLGSFPPLYFSIMNGFILGSFSYSIALEKSLAFTVAAILPHGIIEVPTILLGSAAGMGLGYQLINRLRGRGSIGVELILALRLFVTRIVPLLLIAAVVEVTLTPFLVVILGFA
jgi:stage II sporulation protein M